MIVLMKMIPVVILLEFQAMIKMICTYHPIALWIWDQSKMMDLNEIDLIETWDLNITRTSSSFLIDFDVRWHLYISLYLSTTQRSDWSTEWFKMKSFWPPSDSSIIWIVMKITLLEVWMITVSYRSCVASHTW